jgi:FkbM family methyltransferase
MRAEVEATGSWQIDRLRAALDYVDDFTLALDIGAHVGLWTIELAKRFDKVIAFEPNRRAYECLVKNTETLSNVERLKYGVSNYNGYAYVEDDDRLGAQNTGGSFLVREGGHPHNKVGIAALDLTEMFAPPSFLKIDVEGWEAEVLEGAQETISEARPVILFENKPKFRNRSSVGEEPTAILARLGYREVAHFGADRLWKYKGD